MEILNNLERENGIKIIYAVEAGSRAHGWDSDISDYDIRFVYMMTDRKSYLSLQESKKPMPITGKSKNEKFEWEGWDLSQFLKRLQELNLTAIEWIYSPFVHLNTEPNFLTRARFLVESQNRTKPLFDDYLGPARQNYTKLISKEKKVSS